MSSLLTHEPLLRGSAFTGILLAMALWELLAPRRQQSQRRGARWPSNLGITILNTLLMRVVFPLGAVGVAALAAQHAVGIFNALRIAPAVSLLCSMLLLDLAIYTQHVVFHRVPWLWRLHRMHHADTALDVTSGSRFHPIEMLLSMVIKVAIVLAFGMPPLAVLLFEVVLNATAMFNHANARLPLPIDRVLRYLLVTPDMHRVHHSTVVAETHSNFGFNLPWWDRLFRTYRAQPEAGHQHMTIGLPEFRALDESRLDRMLTQPWRNA
ncbi:MAG: sterol desaturase family protein [Acidobacteriaceae bacterium]|jgi:sterol desaturase/sphingolipid hydroxylase (fatty acid hydroxylase superfamily)|nr:sterol desaturase family protein [Acidobacteriaceae bacterium]